MLGTYRTRSRRTIKYINIIITWAAAAASTVTRSKHKGNNINKCYQLQPAILYLRKKQQKKSITRFFFFILLVYTEIHHIR